MNVDRFGNRTCVVGSVVLYLSLRNVVCRLIHGCVYALHIWYGMRDSNEQVLRLHKERLENNRFSLCKMFTMQKMDSYT